MNRKAQGIGINVVIIAAIALLVLVIIGLVVSGGGRQLAEGTQSCEAQGGTCGLPDGASALDYEIIDASCGGAEQCYRYRFGG